MNKRILLSLGTLVVAGAVIAGGTGAFFSDTETSTGNVFTAGSVTVGIEGITHTYNGVDQTNSPNFSTNNDAISFTLSDLKPLDEGDIDYDLINGENEAFICALVTETENNDNGVNDPESDAGDTTDGVGNGELGDFLNFSFNGNSGSLSAISGLWQTVGTAAPNASTSSGFEYCFGEFDGSGACVLGSGDDNLAQTDSLSADVEFYAVQTRNNEGFSCSDLNEDVTPPPTPVVLGATIINPTNGGTISRSNDDFVTQTTGLPVLDANDTGRFELFNSATCSGAPFISRIATQNPAGTFVLDGNAFTQFVSASCVRFTLYDNAQNTNSSSVIVQSAGVPFSFTN